MERVLQPKKCGAMAVAFAAGKCRLYTGLSFIRFVGQSNHWRILSAKHVRIEGGWMGSNPAHSIPAQFVVPAGMSSNFHRMAEIRKQLISTAWHSSVHPDQFSIHVDQLLVASVRTDTARA